MNDFIVHRDTGMCRISARTVLVAVTGALGSKARDEIAARLFQVLRRDTGPNQGLELLKHGGGDSTRLAHLRNPLLVFDGNCHAFTRFEPGARSLVSIKRPSVR